MGRKLPGSDLLERYRLGLLARSEELMQEAKDLLAIAEALNQVLPSDVAAGPAAPEEKKPAPKNGRKKAKKGRKAKKKTPPKS